MKEIKKFNPDVYKKNIYSQFGEDGIIEEVLIKRLSNISDKQCCEFGAWDGKFLSNTCNLITNYNFNAILIESNKKKFKQLQINFPDKKIIKLNKFVNFTGENTLDNILENNNFNKNFDFLSIDIDGCDYYIFESLNKFTPKLISIEFNPTISNKVNFIQKKDMSINQGSSAKALINLAVAKNYFPIASAGCNLIFIHNSLKKKLTDLDTIDIDQLIPNSNDNYVFCGYDGTVFMSKELNLIHHGIKVKKLSILPSFLNRYPPNYNVLQKIIWYFYLFFKNPLKYLRNKKKYIIIFYEKLFK